MDGYKPLVTKKGLKELCRIKTEEYDTPLEQTRQVIQELTKLRAKKLYKYEPGEWGEEPENQAYMKIARSYHKKRADKAKARKEARMRLYKHD